MVGWIIKLAVLGLLIAGTILEYQKALNLALFALWISVGAFSFLILLGALLPANSDLLKRFTTIKSNNFLKKWCFRLYFIFIISILAMYSYFVLSFVLLITILIFFAMSGENGIINVRINAFKKAKNE